MLGSRSRTVPRAISGTFRLNGSVPATYVGVTTVVPRELALEFAGTPAEPVERGAPEAFGPPDRATPRIAAPRATHALRAPSGPNSFEEVSGMLESSTR